MTPAELASELNLTPEKLAEICRRLGFSVTESVGFSTQQVLKISTNVSEQRLAVKAASGEVSTGTMDPPDQVSPSLPKKPASPAKPPGDTSKTIGEQETAGGQSSSRGAVPDIEYKPIAERFDVQEELGAGGMGRVSKAFDRKLQRTVAIKRLKEGGKLDDELLTRFVHEALSAARVNHPNIVAVYDLLRDDEGPYLVLEFIEGESLADRLLRGSIPCQEAVELLLPICDAVIAAHAQGIIHRDIKPANIFLTKNGVPKLGDFGIARSLNATGMTLTGAALGTLDYMAPEQMNSARTADARSDIYSLGATLYHMVTGESPRPISTDEIPAALRSIIIKALSRDPDKRQGRSVDFAADLSRISFVQSQPLRHDASDTSREPIADDDDDDDSDIEPVDDRKLRRELIAKPFDLDLRRKYLVARGLQSYEDDKKDSAFGFWNGVGTVVCGYFLTSLCSLPIVLILVWLGGDFDAAPQWIKSLLGFVQLLFVIGYSNWCMDDGREKKAREIGPVPVEHRTKSIEELRKLFL